MKNDEVQDSGEIIFHNAWNPHKVTHAPAYHPASAAHILTWCFGFTGIAVLATGAIFGAVPLMVIGAVLLMLMVGTALAKFGGLMR